MEQYYHSYNYMTFLLLYLFLVFYSPVWQEMEG